MAERVGFEPTVQSKPHTRFPGVLLKPLGHLSIGGEGGIRTHGALSNTTVFKTVTLNRSVTSPCCWCNYNTNNLICLCLINLVTQPDYDVCFHNYFLSLGFLLPIKVEGLCNGSLS